jgi:uncharacterized lipoprotein YmbA
MRTLARVLALALALTALLAGCAAGPPSRFYSLTAVPPRASLHAPGLMLQIAAVHIPAILDRQEIVRESTPNLLQLSNRNRWGAPLAAMIRQVLEQDLAARLRGSTVLPAEAAAPAGTHVLVIDLLRFDVGPSGTVRLQGSWMQFAPDGTRPVLTRQITLAAAHPASGYRSQTAAMSRLLGRLADRIAATVTRRPAQLSSGA